METYFIVDQKTGLNQDIFNYLSRISISCGKVWSKIYVPSNFWPQNGSDVILIYSEFTRLGVKIIYDSALPYGIARAET